VQKIFISYEHDHRNFAGSLKLDLEHAGFTVWMDQSDIPGGRPWLEAIETGIHEADRVVICLTPKALASSWVRYEILLAQNKAFIPIMVEECYDQLADSPVTQRLRRVHIIDFKDPDTYEESLTRLIAAFRHEVPQPMLKSVHRFSGRSDFMEAIEHLGQKAKRIVMIGTGLNMLQNHWLQDLIVQRALAGECALEIYLADPTSPDVEARLIEEETGHPKPDIGFKGIIHRIDMLLKYNTGTPESKLAIKLFRNYPTFALLIIDDEYFFYPYSYAHLGNFSPVFQFSKTNIACEPVVEFLDAHYTRIKAAALDAQIMRDLQTCRTVPQALAKNKRTVQDLKTFALYFIPAADSGFYQFGTDVLGYDVRQQTELQSEFADQVGGARYYGIHLTITDALYFLSEHERQRAIEEIRFVAQRLDPFALTNLQIEWPYPGPDTVSIRLEDRSGTLEALHYELIHRVFRRAAASNYSLGLAPVSSQQHRCRALISRSNATTRRTSAGL
jgi:hypothetical protein